MWDTVGGPTGYNAASFYTSSQNADGHSSQLSARCPPELLRAVDVMVSSGYFPPLKTTSDLVRDAIHHRLQQLNTMLGDGEVDEVLRSQRILHERIEREERLVNLHKQVRDIERVVAGYGPDGTEQAVIFLRGVLEEVAGMPPFWRDRYRGEITARFGRLLEEGD